MKAMRIIFFSIALALLAACSSTKKSINTTNLSDLESISQQPTQSIGTPELNQLRVKALEDTAMSLGAQGGLAFSSELINKRLAKDRKYLDTIFNFNGMMLSHGVLPPVLQQADNAINITDPNTIRIADKTYKIIAQARFASTPPNWREYLWLSYSKPDLPTNFLLPKTPEEQAVWVKAVKRGWEKGIQQSYSIFQQNLARLKRDYQGMILYRKLLQENMVSAPYVSRTNLGVTGDGENMNVNDQVLRITELPKLNTESNNWRAIVVKHNDN